ncbi:MAG: ribonuclease P protein subunit [Candidatus Nanoarchaeia archaeon]|nr:ribonuclease P protein subunit [Candidatus Nanoarchaeia archaeon]
MEINKKKLAKSELIGLNIKVIRSDNPFNEGVNGKIIDETKNMIVIETEKQQKKLIKDQCVFEFMLNNEKITIQGKSINKKPEDRIKQR